MELLSSPDSVFSVVNSSIMRRMSETGSSLGGQPRRKMQGAGGTPGGFGEFFIGAGLAAVGFYLLFHRVMVQTSFGHRSGFGGFGQSFGLTLLPLLLGIGVPLAVRRLRHIDAAMERV